MLGALLVIAGVAALVLPGPGLLLILFGLVVWASEFKWAADRVDFMREKALSAAEAGVQNWSRIVASTLSALLVMVVGVFWGLDVKIPELWVVGPDLPFGGWATGAVIIAGGFVALGLLGYSIRRFRTGGRAPSQAQRQRA